MRGRDIYMERGGGGEGQITVAEQPQRLATTPPPPQTTDTGSPSLKKLSVLLAVRGTETPRRAVTSRLECGHADEALPILPSVDGSVTSRVVASRAPTTVKLLKPRGRLRPNPLPAATTCTRLQVRESSSTTVTSHKMAETAAREEDVCTWALSTWRRKRVTPRGVTSRGNVASLPKQTRGLGRIFAIVTSRHLLWEEG